MPTAGAPRRLVRSAPNALANTIAGSPDAVWRFLTGLAVQVGPQVQRDLQALRQAKYEGLGRLARLTTNLENVTVEDWEVPGLVNRPAGGLRQGQRCRGEREWGGL